MFQFDIVMQKQNLGDHRQVHPAMHMPSHGEFLVELLVRTGFKSGLMFGLDDFGERAAVLNQSQAELLIVCGADQHLSQAFYTGWQQLRRSYACRVLIVSEPIFSPLAFYVDARLNAEARHARFLELFEPQIVLYLSRYDVEAAQRRYPGAFVPLLYSLADASLCATPQIPWEHKRQGLLYLGKREAWEYSRAPAGALSRAAQFDLFMGQQRLFFGSSFDKFSFRQCYEIANQFRFQLQLRSGYAFHSARTVQSALVGSVPVVILHKDELPLLYAEAPFARPDHNLLLGLEHELDILFDKLADPALGQHLHRHVGELLAGGTISQGVSELAQVIHQLLSP